MFSHIQSFVIVLKVFGSSIFFIPSWIVRIGSFAFFTLSVVCSRWSSHFFPSLYYFFCSLSKQGVATCCVHGPWQEQHSWWVSLRSLQTPSYWPETGKSNAGKINSSNHNVYNMWRPSFTNFFCSDAYHFAIFRHDVAMKFENLTIQVQATVNLMQTNVGIQKSQNLAKKRQTRRQLRQPLLLKKVN